MTIKFKALLLVLLISTYFATACGQESNIEKSAAGSSCTEFGIDGANEMFTSTVDLEVGSGPNGGVILGKWSLTFIDDKLHWHYSDVVEVLDYHCINDKLFINGKEVSSVTDSRNRIMSIKMNTVDYERKSNP